MFLRYYYIVTVLQAEEYPRPDSMISISASVKWYIPPLDPNEPADHFCLKVEGTSSNDVNMHNNTVYSIVTYVPYFVGGGPPMPILLAIQRKRVFRLN
jgi:hypothetical protein